MGDILAVFEREMPTVSAFRIAFQNIFSGTDMEFQIKKNIEVSSDDLSKINALILIRPHNYLSMKIAEIAHKRGIFVITFLDDDLLSLPKSEAKMPWRMEQLKATLKLSDVILSSNKTIADRYVGYTRGRRNVSINTVVSDDEFSVIPTPIKNEKVKIVYAAGRNHEELFFKFISPCLEEINRLIGDKITLDFVGVHPEIDTKKLKFPVRYHDSLPLLEYRKLMRESHYDIGLAPLNKDPFSECKYFNKYIEYTLVGVTGIYSNVKPYTYIIENGINGFLTDNDSNSWLENILLAVNEKDLREKCLYNAKAQLKNDFNVNKIREKLLDDIPELLIAHTVHNKSQNLLFIRMIYKLYRILDSIYLSFFYIRRGGIKLVINKIFYHIKHTER